MPGTGSELLASTIELLRGRDPAVPLRFVITGTGPGAGRLQALDQPDVWPAVEFRGKVSRSDYDTILRQAQVSLALKLCDSGFGETTFPSKVIEIAAAGLALVTTPISDVPWLFGPDGAFYVEEETPAALAALFTLIARDPATLAAVARTGQERIVAECNPAVLGRRLEEFFLDSPPS